MDLEADCRNIIVTVLILFAYRAVRGLTVPENRGNMIISRNARDANATAFADPESRVNSPMCI